MVNDDRKNTGAFICMSNISGIVNGVGLLFGQRQAECQKAKVVLMETWLFMRDKSGFCFMNGTAKR